jgi:hypothetical protein
MTAPTLGVNQFALDNHTPRKGSHFERGSWDALIALVREHWSEQEPGFTEGCVEIPVPPRGFFAGIVDLRTLSPDTLSMGVLRARFEPREGIDEEPMITVRVPSAYKARATSVRVICYSHDLLGKDASTDAEWEIVTILAQPFEKPAPMPPITMARNFLGLEGGTKGEFTAQQFAESILFWAQHAVAADSD